jgi:hypothetical protein
MRIAKAVKERSKGKVKALQWLLTHSFYANKEARLLGALSARAYRAMRA